MPRVSVLLTCYNHLAYIGEALDGLAQQTYRDFEVIALDDGSQDGTREYLLENAEKFGLRIEFNSKNLGTYGTLNRGLELASGEFIAILNDDDVWLPNKLAGQVEMMDRDPKIGLAHTGGWFIDGQRQRIEGSPLGFPFPDTPTGDLFTLLVDHNQIIASSTLFRSACVAETGPFDPSFYGCGDWHMWLRIAERWHVGYLRGDHTLYRIHGANACLDEGKMNEDGLRIRSWIEGRAGEIIAGAPDRPGIVAALAHNSACLGTEFGWRGDVGRARQAYVRSIRLMPWRFKSYARLAATLLPRKLFRALN